jgi:hypothetical protein
LEFKLASKWKVVPYHSLYQIAKFGKFWSNRSRVFIISKFVSVWEKGKAIVYGPGHE